MSSKNKIFTSPWKYREGYIIILLLLILGLFIEYFIPYNDHILKFPFNAYFGIVFISLLIFLYINYKNQELIKWFASSYAAIPSIIVYAFFSVIIVLIPKGSFNEHTLITKLGLNNITYTWYFLFIQLFFLSSLGLTTIRRVSVFKTRDIGFALNHAGLFVVVFAAGLGSSDIQRYMMKMEENKAVWYVSDELGNTYEMPFALKLLNFDIDYYNPNLVVIHNNTGEIIASLPKGENEITENSTIELMDCIVKVEKYHENSGKVGESYHPVNDIGASPSALLDITNKNGENIKGWISCGSVSMTPQALRCTDTSSFVMMFPQAKKYSSKIQAYTKEGDNDTLLIEVNKPLKIMNWNVYQTSYDEKMGKWSNISIVDIISDPWLPVIYFGIYLLIAGALFMFWSGTKKKNHV